MSEPLACNSELNVPPIQDSYIVEDSDIVLDSYIHSQSETETGQLLHVVTAACRILCSGSRFGVHKHSWLS